MEERKLIEIGQYAGQIQEEWGILSLVARLAGFILQQLRPHLWFDQEARKGLSYDLQQRLLKAEMPPRKPSPFPQGAEPSLDDLEHWRMELEGEERFLRQVERDLCEAGRQIRVVLARPGPEFESRKEDALPSQFKAGVEALLAWHATHREQDRKAKRKELERLQKQWPQEAAALDRKLQRLNGLSLEQLLESGPDDWDSLLLDSAPLTGQRR